MSHEQMHIMQAISEWKLLLSEDLKLAKVPLNNLKNGQIFCIME